MVRDFTLKVYQDLLNQLNDAGYGIINFEAFLGGQRKRSGKYVILRHDVDRKPLNALRMAQIEQKNGIRASYYFRIVPESYDDKIISAISKMGHELGYHYEDLSLANGDLSKAYQYYQNHLERFQQLVPVRTVCMHGSPLSKWDNRNLWNYYDYRVKGVIGEPYLDVDFERVLYLSDTGRNWLNSRASVRDRVTDQPYGYRSTFQLIERISQGDLPENVMINVHPERWRNEFVPWANQLIGQNLRNVVKYLYTSFGLSNTGYEKVR